MDDENTAPDGSGGSAGVRLAAQEVRFASGGEVCAATLYRPEASNEVPCVVMGNGASFTRVDGLPRFAERFVDAGIAALTFDFRHLGGSSGEPRQLTDLKRQRQDFTAAIAFARSLDSVDPDRVAVWGFSTGGGIALSTAAADDRLAAAVLLSPMVDGLAFTLAAGLRKNVHMTAEMARAALGRRTAQLPAFGPPGSHALNSQPEAVHLPEALVADGSTWQNEVRANPSQLLPLFRPVQEARRVRCPLLVCIGDDDTIVPLRPVERTAKRAPRGELRRYPMDHSGGFLDRFDQVAGDQVEFLKDHLKPSLA